jgi:ribosomal protein S18 acetylase RimI-like enzyme
VFKGCSKSEKFHRVMYQIVSSPSNDAVHKFLAAFLTYENSTFPDCSAEEYASRKSPDATFVAKHEDSGELLGVIAVRRFEVVGTSLVYLAVHDGYRRRGIASALVEHVWKNFPDVNYLHVPPEVGNDGGVKFYEKNGFVKETSCDCEDCKHYLEYICF